jgi:F0F1-type ATP synthase epsilon subunit
MFVTLENPAKKFALNNIESLVLPTCSGSSGILQGHIPVITGLEIDTIQLKQRGKDKKLYQLIFVVTGKAVAEVRSDRGDTRVSVFAEGLVQVIGGEGRPDKLNEENVSDGGNPSGEDENSYKTEYGIEDIPLLKEALETIETEISQIESNGIYINYPNRRNINKSGSAYSPFLYNGTSSKSQYVSTSGIAQDREYKVCEKKLNTLYQRGRITRAILKGMDLISTR